MKEGNGEPTHRKRKRIAWGTVEPKEDGMRINKEVMKIGTKYCVNITVIDLTSLDDQHNNTNESVHFVCTFISVVCYAKKIHILLC